MSHVSNALGTINAVKRRSSRSPTPRSVPVLVDGAQAAPHLPIDVKDLGCDFYAVSAHKMYGPTGIGALYGREEWLEKLPPYQGGGDMIASVTFEKTTYNELPWKFEAGTANIAGGIGFGDAIDWLSGRRAFPDVAAHEHDLLVHATAKLSAIAGLTIVGPREARRPPSSPSPRERPPARHRHDPRPRGHRDPHRPALRAAVMDRFGIPATARASFGLYNTRDEVDALAAGLAKVSEMFG